MITNSCPFPPPYSFLLLSLLLSTFPFTPFYFPPSSFLLLSFLLHLLAFAIQKLRKRHAKAKKMRGKSLAFANRLDKYLLLNGLQREVRREVGRSKKGKSFP